MISSRVRLDDVEADRDLGGDERHGDRDHVQPERGPAPPRDAPQGALGDVVDEQRRLPRDVADEQAERQRGEQQVDAVEKDVELPSASRSGA